MGELGVSRPHVIITMARIIEVIETYERRGKGTNEDPVRRVLQLWSKDGKLIHEEKTQWDEGE